MDRYGTADAECRVDMFQRSQGGQSSVKDTQPDTSQIFGKRTVSKTIFGSSSLFCMGCGMFDKPPCDLLHGQSSRHLKEPFARYLPKTGCTRNGLPKDIQRHICLGRQGTEFTNALALRYGHNLSERGTRVVCERSENCDFRYGKSSILEV